MDRLEFVGVLFPVSPTRSAGSPHDHPLGRAALALAKEGVVVVLGDKAEGGGLSGQIATQTGWERVVGAPIRSAFNRYPSRSRAREFEALRQRLPHVLLANSPVVLATCADKLICQTRLVAAGVAMPEVVVDPSQFDDALQRWGDAFYKPRFGSFGEGVERLSRLDAARPCHDDAVLQRAITPPSPWVGFSIRQLVQRDLDGRWLALPAVARTSVDDPVANVARGAIARPLTDVLAGAVEQSARIAIEVAEVLDDGVALEFGVDLVPDQDGRLWVIEVNGKPAGRLEALARLDPERFGDARDQAAERPLRCLASWARSGRAQPDSLA